MWPFPTSSSSSSTALPQPPPPPVPDAVEENVAEGNGNEGKQQQQAVVETSEEVQPIQEPIEPRVSPIIVTEPEPLPSSKFSLFSFLPTTTTTTTTQPVATTVSTSQTPLPVLPPPPKQPYVLTRTDNSILLCWSDDVPDHQTVLSQSPPLSPSLPNPTTEYEIRYARAQYRYDPWTPCPTLTKQQWLNVKSLTPGTAFIFHVRCRPTPTSPWGIPSEASTPIRTLPRNEQERINNLARVRRFILDGSAALEKYLEDEAIPDTIVDKAQRSVEGLIYTASTVGIGGSLMQLSRNLWRVYKTGIGSLIFHPDLQQTVYVLLSFLNVVTSEIKMTSKDAAVGSYFALWEAKRQRLLHPMNELLEHSEGAVGVIRSEVPAELMNELMWYFPLAGAAYRKTPAQMQWVLNQFPIRSSSGAWRLVAARCLSEKFKPAFMLVINEKHKTAIFSIRGTSEVDDLVTDGLCDVHTASFGFHDDSQDNGGVKSEFHVHAGMLKAAEWLIQGDDRHGGFALAFSDGVPSPSPPPPPPPASGTVVDQPPPDDSDGAGVGAMTAKLYAAGYKEIVFTGHSMGAGVATLVALLLADRFRDLKIKMYGYGTPACVDERLAEACKGLHASAGFTPIPGLGSRVTVKNVICHDDIIPRLSLKTASDFACELKATKDKWGPLLTDDINSFMQRIKTVWAPNQRAHALVRGGPSERITSNKIILDGATATTPMVQSVITPDPDTIRNERLKKSLTYRLAPPGLIAHTYLHHGTHRISLVDYTFPALRRIEAFENCIEDHRFNSILNAVRSAAVAKECRRVGRHPPHWENLSDHANDATEWQVRCRVCTYPVSWCNTSSSEASEIRATYHCHACGMIVCALCSDNKVPLPSIGILQPVRVCDICVYKLGAQEPNGLMQEVELCDEVMEW